VGEDGAREGSSAKSCSVTLLSMFVCEEESSLVVGVVVSGTMSEVGDDPLLSGDCPLASVPVAVRPSPRHWSSPSRVSSPRTLV